MMWSQDFPPNWMKSRNKKGECMMKKKESMRIALEERRELMNIALEERKQLICIKKEKNEVEKMKVEDKIMMKDIRNMNFEQNEYILLRRLEILKKLKSKFSL